MPNAVAVLIAPMVASGFAGLGYQVVWTQQASLWLGHEAPAVLAVITAFFGGLATGSLLLGDTIARSPRPARWYAACEGVIALWSLALAGGLAPVSSWMLGLTGAQPAPLWQWSVAFVGSFLLLLPATAAMGATLPALERVLAQRGPRRPAIAALYAGNTFGALVGVLATAFWLVPALGLTATAALCAALNLGCAGWVLWLGRGSVAALPIDNAETAAGPTAAAAATPVAVAAGDAPAGLGAVAAPMGPPTPKQSTARRQSGAHGAPRAPHLLALLAATGLLGIGYEVLVVRVLSQVTEDTVYTFALLLAVYLGGTALGAAAYQRWTRQPTAASQANPALCAGLLALLAAACCAGTFSLFGAQWLNQTLQQALGGGMAAALAAEGALALVAFALPTLLMGALFSHLCTQAAAAGVSFGRALGVNTAAAALAPLLFGVLLAPAAGPKGALLTVAASYLALALALAMFSMPAAVPTRGAAASQPGAGRKRGVVIWGTGGASLAAIGALALWAGPLAFVDVPEGGRIVSYQDGTMAAVSVVEDADGVARLRINNRQQEGSSATGLADSRQALLPLLLHPAPQRALFLGLGTGVTASAAAHDGTLLVDAAELLPEVIAASAHFTAARAAHANDAVATSNRPRLNLVAADARRFVRAPGPSYDVIVSDNFHPARSGSGALYTVEHFTAVRQRLAPGGVFCQWLPLHQLDLDTLRSIVRSFIHAHPGGWAMLATNSLQTPVLGLVARARDGGFNAAALRERLARMAALQPLARYGLHDELSVLGSFVAGPLALARFAATAPLNTDDHPVVAYRAPRITYAPDSTPSDRLLELLRQLSLQPSDLLDAASAADTSGMARLAAYWQARNRFLDIGRTAQISGDARRTLAQLQQPLLALLHISPDFRPAYDPLLRLALALAANGAAADVDAARALLLQLTQAQPERPEAEQALRRLAGGS